MQAGADGAENNGGDAERQLSEADWEGWRTRPAAVRGSVAAAQRPLSSTGLTGLVPFSSSPLKTERPPILLPRRPCSTGDTAGLCAESWGLVCSGRLRQGRRADDDHGHLPLRWVAGPLPLSSCVSQEPWQVRRRLVTVQHCTAGGLGDLLLTIPVAVGELPDVHAAGKG